MARPTRHLEELCERAASRFGVDLDAQPRLFTRTTTAGLAALRDTAR